MDEASIVGFILDTFDGVETATSSGNTFFFYGPERMFPFATLVTNDDYDQESGLNRASVYRLNIGVSKETFRSLFGVPPSRQTASEEGAAAGKEYDFTALDRVMPHPIYSRQYWVCVLNPSDQTFQQVVRPLLAEAYERDVSKHKKRAARS